jgi:hypothetical protein
VGGEHGRSDEMPRKKPGHTFLSVEVPDALLAALVANAEAHGESASARVCRLIAADIGHEYSPPARGPAPGTKYKSKPGPKPAGQKPAKKKSK